LQPGIDEQTRTRRSILLEIEQDSPFKRFCNA